MSAENRTIRIGSRGSPLALAQVELVEAALAEKCPGLRCERVIIATSGDWKPEHGEVRLSEKAGGKAQFAKEIEEALLSGEIDAAVHSMKDMDSNLPQGLVINHMLPREDVRDCLLFSNNLAGNSHFNYSDIPQAAKVGTASVRRSAFLLSERPDVSIEPIRGNVQTRIEKVRNGQVDLTMLAMAGLKRLGLECEADIVLAVEDMLPAAGQGAVGIEIRSGDDDISAIFSQIYDEKTVFCVKAERSVLKTLNGSCHSPIGAYAVIEDNEMWLRVRVSSSDGMQIFDDDIRGSAKTIEDAQSLGRVVGERLKAIIPVGIL